MVVMAFLCGLVEFLIGILSISSGDASYYLSRFLNGSIFILLGVGIFLNERDVGRLNTELADLKESYKRLRKIKKGK